MFQVNREYEVQCALYKVGFPVPRPIIYCDDPSIIGTEFYVMEHVQVCNRWSPECVKTYICVSAKRPSDIFGEIDIIRYFDKGVNYTYFKPIMKAQIK